jgi:hypothetical protein
MTFFQFEADFVDSLRCIPMQVRLKLDTCGIKLKLADWFKMDNSERQNLVDLPCQTVTEIQAYREYLQNLITRTGSSVSELPIDSHPEWLDDTTIPVSVQTEVTEVGITLGVQQWAALTPIQRFALIKLSRSGHENNNFLPALREFHLVESRV